MKICEGPFTHMSFLQKNSENISTPHITEILWDIMHVCKMTILWERLKPTYFTNFSSKLQKITKFSIVLLVNKTRLYWNITFTIIYIDKIMTKYSTELSEVYVRNRGIAPV